MTTAERRRAILKALNVRRYDTRDHLAEEFKVTSRTITNDVLALSLSYPVYSTHGKNGGIYIMEDFHLFSSKLSEKERSLLKQLCATLSGEDRETLKSIIKKTGG